VLVARVLDKRIDAQAAPDLKAKVGARIDQGERRAVLDMGEVEFVDSTGLGAVLSLLKRVAPGGALVLCGCRPPVLELLRLTRLDRVFKTFPGQTEAVASLSG
jgi:anti-sigma B factor antagonist